MSLSLEAQALANFYDEIEMYTRMGDHGQGYDPEAEPYTDDELAQVREASGSYRRRQAQRCQEADAMIARRQAQH